MWPKEDKVNLYISKTYLSKCFFFHNVKSWSLDKYDRFFKKSNTVDFYSLKGWPFNDNEIVDNLINYFLI